MEAMHTSDLMFFRCSSPTPIPRLFASADKDDCTNVSSEMIDRDIGMQEVEQSLTVAPTPTLKVSAHDERRLQIQNVRNWLPVDVFQGNGNIVLFSFSAELSFRTLNIRYT